MRERVRLDGSIRLTGAALLAIAALAVRALLRLPGHPGYPAANAYALAAIAYFSGSVGTLLLLCGARLLDRVPVSTPWLAHPIERSVGAPSEPRRSHGT